MAGDAVAPVALGACHPRAAIEDIGVLLAATEDDEPIMEPSSGHRMISKLERQRDQYAAMAAANYRCSLMLGAIVSAARPSTRTTRLRYLGSVDQGCNLYLR